MKPDPVDIGSSENSALGLTEYQKFFKKFWKIIAIGALLGLVAGYTWAHFQPKVYSATSTGLVLATSDDNLAVAYAGEQFAKSKAKGFSSLATSTALAESVLGELGLNRSTVEQLANVSALVPRDTTEVHITVRDESPEMAQKLANSWLSALSTKIEGLGARIQVDPNQKSSLVQLVPLADAELPDTPVSPKVLQAVLIGAILGTLVGIAIGIVRSVLDRRVHSAEQIEVETGINIIGALPRDSRLMSSRQIVQSADISQQTKKGFRMSEALRELRNNLKFVDVDNPPRSVVVTSSVPAEGKSSVTANLAVTIASTGQKVVLIDADLRRPVVNEIFSAVGEVGLTEVLTHQATADDVLQPWAPNPNLSLMTSGAIPPNPAELLSSESMRQLIEELSQDALVLLDSPPILSVADSAFLSTITDGVLLVVNAGKTSLDEVKKSETKLRLVRATILGGILNQIDTSSEENSSYGYYSYYARPEQISE